MNTLKNIAKKAVAVGTGSLLLGATLMAGVAAADLKDYPAPFVTNGQFNGLIVVGEKAATSDVLGSIEIASALQAASTTTVDVAGAGTTTMGGDSKLLQTGSQSLEIGDFIGGVVQRLTDSDLQFLKGGQVSTQRGTTDFTQIIALDTNPTNANSGTIRLDERTSDRKTGMYLYFADRQPLFRYELQFTSGLQSKIDATSLRATDLERENIFMLGQWFNVARVDTVAAGPTVNMQLISGQSSDTLTEGQTKTYTVAGKQYEVTLVTVSNIDGGSATAKFLVNGQTTKSLIAGDTEKVSGIDVGVREILGRSGVATPAMVEFYLGANKVEFRDAVITNAAQDGTVRINGNSYSDATVDISGSFTGTTDVRVDKITYILKARAAGSRDVYLEKGQGIRSFLDKPEGMLADKWDFVYQGLTEPSTTPIEFRANGNQGYDLTFTNNRGDTFTGIPLVYNPTGAGAMYFGDQNGERLQFFEAKKVAGAMPLTATDGDYLVSFDDYIVLSTNGGASDTDDTYVVQWSNVNTADTTVEFRDAASGTTHTSTYVANAGTILSPSNGTLTLGGKNFNYWFYVNGSTYHMAVDNDGSGTYGGGAGVIDKTNIVVKGGGILDLDEELEYADFAAAGQGSSLTNPAVFAADMDWNASLTTQGRNTNSRDDQAVGIPFDGTAVADHFSITGLDGNIDGSGLTVYQERAVRNEDRTLGIDQYGAMYDRQTNTGNNDANSLEIAYPSSQKLGQVYVTGGNVQASAVSSGGAVRVNPIGVGVAQLDTNVRYDQANMIVVGGPCANTMAAQLLNNPKDCAEGFAEGTAMLKLFNTGKNTALLVAGFSAQDTQGASRVLAEHADYNLAGTEADLTVTSLSSIKVTSSK